MVLYQIHFAIIQKVTELPTITPTLVIASCAFVLNLVIQAVQYGRIKQEVINLRRDFNWLRDKMFPDD